jgi:hypothetical protein
MSNTETTTYEIVTLEEDGEWVTDYVGAENTFTTIDDALDAIRSLRELGGERAEAWYAVCETGTYQPIYGTERGVESTTCVFCDADLHDADADVPAIDDDDAWAALEGDHAPGCKWVDTRAGRHNAWHSFTVYVEAPSRIQAREYLDSQLLPGMRISD